MVCSNGAVRAEGVDCGPEAGNSNPKSLSSAVRTATTFKDKSSKDFRERDMVALVWDFGSSALRLLRELSPPSLIILRANRPAGVKRMTVRWMRVACARPARSESSQIVNSHYEKPKRGLIRGDQGERSRIEGFS